MPRKPTRKTRKPSKRKEPAKKEAPTLTPIGAHAHTDVSARLVIEALDAWRKINARRNPEKLRKIRNKGNQIRREAWRLKRKNRKLSEREAILLAIRNLKI